MVYAHGMTPTRVSPPPPQAATLPTFAVDAAHAADPAQLHAAEQRLLRRVEAARSPGQRLSRLRVLLLFVLLRHAGLRFGEAVAFDDTRDFDFKRRLLNVRGPHAREVPLPPPVAQRISDILNSPEVQGQRGTLARLDGGYVRRSFYARARECGLPPGLLSARALRNARAVELCRSGMPLKIVHAFLGQSSHDRTTALLHYSTEDAHTIINHYLRREMQAKTSARNVFPGRVTSVQECDFLVDVRLETFGGLCISAIITDRSRDTLGLVPGSTAIATIKAPWVSLTRPGTPLPPLPGNNPFLQVNRFAGRVSNVRRSQHVCEILVDLPEGSQVCSLMPTPSWDALDCETGDETCVVFTAATVILGLDA